MIMTLFLLFVCLCLIQFITCACNYGAKPCEWEPWQPWSSCSRTCGVGYRTRNRNLCCGPIVTDCADNCYRGDNNQQVEVCNDSCPNGATVVDDICQCPPLKYGICCELDESDAQGGGIDCARHCTWLNWYSWGDCGTNCGCGTRERTRDPCCRTTLNHTQCVDDCGFKGGSNEMRQCTKACSSKKGTNGCSLCSWNAWGPWSSCSSTCGGGQRSRSRSPCCCGGQIKDCQADCGLSETGANQKEACNQLCFNGGSFSDKGSCSCQVGFGGKCCSKEVTVGNCKKCSWQAWQAWEETGEDGKLRRKRELCCRIGKSAEDCRSECGAEEHSQVQILMNTEKHLDNQTLTNTTTCIMSESTDTDPHLFLYAGMFSLASVILTSLAWAGCCYLKKRRRASKDKGTRSDPPSEHGYEMSTNDEGVEHHYDSVNTGYVNSDSGCIYENHSF